MNFVLIILAAIMLNSCYKCTTGYSTVCGDYPDSENERFRKEYEEKQKNEKEKAGKKAKVNSEEE